MDQFFRSPQENLAAGGCARLLGANAGVLSVLGLDQASLAVLRMRDTVERLLINEISDADKPGAFEKLGSNLGRWAS